MTYRLFVYGTLAPGRPNEHVLADVPGEWEPATVIGTVNAYIYRLRGKPGFIKE